MSDVTEYNGKPQWAQSKRERANAARVAQGLKPKRRRWPWILLLLVVLGVGGYIGYTMFMQPAPPAAAVVEEVVPAEPLMQVNTFEIATIAPQRLARTIRVSGALAPLTQTEISAQVGGQVAEVLVREGDTVEAGDVLVQLDTRTLQLQLDQQRSTAEATEAQLALAESQLARTRELIDRGLSPSSGLEAAETEAAALRANLAALGGQVRTAEIALEDATIVAPFAGTVSARAVQPGQTIGAGTPVITLVDLSTLQLEATTPISNASAVGVGQDVEVTVEGIARETFVGEVTGISPIALAGTRSLPVFVAIDNDAGTLRGGMFATGQVVIDERVDAMAVPTVALREDEEGMFLLKLEGDILVRQPVETGDAWNNDALTEITSGLGEGDRIIAAALPELAAGDRIELVEF